MLEFNPIVLQFDRTEWQTIATSLLSQWVLTGNDELNLYAQRIQEAINSDKERKRYDKM